MILFLIVIVDLQSFKTISSKSDISSNEGSPTLVHTPKKIPNPPPHSEHPGGHTRRNRRAGPGFISAWVGGPMGDGGSNELAGQYAGRAITSRASCQRTCPACEGGVPDVLAMWVTNTYWYPKAPSATLIH